ncbi:MAG: T9SS type A sorting domain-containing protein [Bacteroidales bacterium]|nr:T9SS type A sorting domain-containing protein [Bacteroidales bacterium]
MKKRPLPLGYFIFILVSASLLLSATLTDNDKTIARNETESEYFALIRNNQVTGQLAPADYLRAMQQMEQRNITSSGRGFDLDWTVLGPNNLGGRTRAILFDKRDPSGLTVFAGSVLGGIFKSVSGGAKWVKIPNECANMNVSCISQSGNGDIFVGTGEAFTVQQYTVLGEWGYTNGFFGQGIFKSTDGETFTLLPSTKPTMNGNQLEWGFINELAAHPADGSLYAATNTGLKFTSDGGSSWQIAKTAEGDDLTGSSRDVKMGSSGIVIAEINNLCYVSENGNPNNFMLRSGDSTYNLPLIQIGRIEFAIAPTNNDIIYALAASETGELKNIYRSDDKGGSWIVVGPGGTSNFNLFGMNNPGQSTIAYGLFNATIEIFPDDPYHIIVGGLNMWEGKKVLDDGFYHWTLRSSSSGSWLSPQFLWQGHHVYKFFPGTSSKLLVGTNGGISMGTISQNFVFQFMNKDYIASQFYTVGWTSEKRNVIGGAQDIGTIYIDGATNPNDGKRGDDIWTTQEGFPNGRTGGYCAVSTIYSTAFIYSRTPHPPKNGNYETFVRRNEFSGGPDWAQNMFSDRYASNAFLSPFLLYENYEDYQTKDSVSFIVTRDYPAGSYIWVESNNGKRPFKYTTPVALSPGDTIMVPDIITARFFAGGDNRIMMSKQVIQFNVFPEWYVISNTETGGFGGVPSCMAHSSDANHLFVGTINGRLYRISNIKYAYNNETADVTSPYCVISTKRIPVYLPGTSNEISQAITSVSIDPNNDNQVIITLGNYGNEHYAYITNNALAETPVFRSVQGVPGSGGLPQMPAYSSLIEMDPDNNLVFVGTESGIYVTNNIESTNPTWVPENHNVGCVPVFMLRQQTVRKGNDTIAFVNVDTTYVIYKGVNNYGVIYGATYGSGLIMLDDFQKPVGIAEPGKMNKTGNLKLYPNPATDRVTVSFEATSPGPVTINIYNLTGATVKSIDLGYRPAGNHEAIINCSGLVQGTYVVRLTTGNQHSSSKFIKF